MKRRTLLGLAGASIASLAGCLGATEYTVTDVSVGESSGPLALAVTIRDAAAEIESPAVLEFALTNESNQPIRVRNVGIWPLGVLVLTQSPPDAPGTGPRIRLWNDRYEKSRYVHVKGKGFGVSSKPLVRPLAAAETVSAMYQIHGENIVQAGRHYLRGFASGFVRNDTPSLCFYALSETEEWLVYLPPVTVSIETISLL